MVQNKENKAENKAEVEEKENQELVALTLEEAETEAKLIKRKAETEAQEILSNAKEAAKNILEKGESFVKELKKAKYIAVNNIKEDGKTIKKGTAYNGKDSKNIKRLLELGAIKLNK